MKVPLTLHTTTITTHCVIDSVWWTEIIFGRFNIPHYHSGIVWVCTNNVLFCMSMQSAVAYSSFVDRYTHWQFYRWTVDITAPLPSPGRRWSVEGGEGNGESRLGELVPADIIRGEEEGSSRREQVQCWTSTQARSATQWYFITWPYLGMRLVG